MTSTYILRILEGGTLVISGDEVVTPPLLYYLGRASVPHRVSTLVILKMTNTYILRPLEDGMLAISGDEVVTPPLLHHLGRASVPHHVSTLVILKMASTYIRGALEGGARSCPHRSWCSRPLQRPAVHAWPTGRCVPLCIRIAQSGHLFPSRWCRLWRPSASELRACPRPSAW